MSFTLNTPFHTSHPTLTSSQAHINVEYYASIKSIKYLYKYVYKGHDCAQVEFTAVPAAPPPDQPAAAAGGAVNPDAVTGAMPQPQPQPQPELQPLPPPQREQQEHQHLQGRVVDEILEYQNGRYVGASEAAWRTFGFKLHGEGAAVERLPVHLPDEQTVVFARDADLTDVVEEGPGITKLQAWFALNERDPAARGLLYMDIPSEYTWQTESSRRVPGPHWKRRVKLLTYPTIGRIYNVGRAQVRSHLRRGLWEVWKLS